MYYIEILLVKCKNLQELRTLWVWWKYHYIQVIENISYLIAIHVFTKWQQHISCLFVVCVILCNKQHNNNNEKQLRYGSDIEFHHSMNPQITNIAIYVVYICRCFCPLAQGYLYNNSAYLNIMSLISHPVSFIFCCISVCHKNTHWVTKLINQSIIVHLWITSMFHVTV